MFAHCSEGAVSITVTVTETGRIPSDIINHYRSQSINLFEFYNFEMENIWRSNSILRCRLCDASGPHDIDIWDKHPHSTEVTMSEKIFECTGLKVCGSMNCFRIRLMSSCVTFSGRTRRLDHKNMWRMRRHDKRIFPFPRIMFSPKCQSFTSKN